MVASNYVNLPDAPLTLFWRDRRRERGYERAASLLRHALSPRPSGENGIRQSSVSATAILALGVSRSLE